MAGVMCYKALHRLNVPAAEVCVFILILNFAQRSALNELIVFC